MDDEQQKNHIVRNFNEIIKIPIIENVKKKKKINTWTNNDIQDKKVLSILKNLIYLIISFLLLFSNSWGRQKSIIDKEFIRESQLFHVIISIVILFTLLNIFIIFYILCKKNPYNFIFKIFKYIIFFTILSLLIISIIDSLISDIYKEKNDKKSNGIQFILILIVIIFEIIIFGCQYIY